MPKKIKVRRQRVPKSVSLILFDDLPSSAKSKGKHKLNRSDLNSSQRNNFDGNDVTAVIDGTSVSIVEPTGNLTDALLSINDQREIEGI
jgi:hypothetical protein